MGNIWRLAKFLNCKRNKNKIKSKTVLSYCISLFMNVFNRAEDAAKGLEQARSRVFFGRKVEAEPHDGVDDSMADYRPPEAELDEYHHKATRTLFVGNLQLDITKEQLKDIFRRYGLILVCNVQCYKIGINVIYSQ